ncbi:hypothetical protein CVT26_005786, partial [Gymnopilus dilepis]
RHEEIVADDREQKARGPGEPSDARWHTLQVSRLMSQRSGKEGHAYAFQVEMVVVFVPLSPGSTEVGEAFTGCITINADRLLSQRSFEQIPTDKSKRDQEMEEETENWDNHFLDARNLPVKRVALFPVGGAGSPARSSLAQQHARQESRDEEDGEGDEQPRHQRPHRKDHQYQNPQDFDDEEFGVLQDRNLEAEEDDYEDRAVTAHSRRAAVAVALIPNTTQPTASATQPEPLRSLLCLRPSTSSRSWLGFRLSSNSSHPSPASTFQHFSGLHHSPQHSSGLGTGPQPLRGTSPTPSSVFSVFPVPNTMRTYNSSTNLMGSSSSGASGGAGAASTSTFGARGQRRGGNAFPLLPPSPPIHQERERRRLRKKSCPQGVPVGMVELRELGSGGASPEGMYHEEEHRKRYSFYDDGVHPGPAPATPSGATQVAVPATPTKGSSSGGGGALLSGMGRVKKWGVNVAAVGWRRRGGSVLPAEFVAAQGEDLQAQAQAHRTPRPPSSVSSFHEYSSSSSHPMPMLDLRPVNSTHVDRPEPELVFRSSSSTSKQTATTGPASPSRTSDNNALRRPRAGTGAASVASVTESAAAAGREANSATPASTSSRPRLSRGHSTRTTASSVCSSGRSQSRSRVGFEEKEDFSFRQGERGRRDDIPGSGSMASHNQHQPQPEPEKTNRVVAVGSSCPLAMMSRLILDPALQRSVPDFSII